MIDQEKLLSTFPELRLYKSIVQEIGEISNELEEPGQPKGHAPIARSSISERSVPVRMGAVIRISERFGRQLASH